MRFGEDSNFIRWLRIGTVKSTGKKPVESLSGAVVKALAKVMPNQRDKAIHRAKYVSGFGISELLTLKVKDAAFYEYGALLHVTGKTGYRSVQITGRSVYEPQKWMMQMPLATNDVEWFFSVLERPNRGRHLEETNIRKLLTTADGKAGIKRRLYPHVFRHTKASPLAPKVSESIIERTMGIDTREHNIMSLCAFKL
ncbi:MAG: tyrosine-type recombinase/integrase [Thermoplasmatales archaeon]